MLCASLCRGGVVYWRAGGLVLQCIVVRHRGGVVAIGGWDSALHACGACRFGLGEFRAAGEFACVGFVLQPDQHSPLQLRRGPSLSQGTHQAYGKEAALPQAAVAADAASAIPAAAVIAFVEGGRGLHAVLGSGFCCVALLVCVMGSVVACGCLRCLYTAES